MAKGSSGGQPSQTTTQTLAPQAGKLLDLAMPFAEQFASSGGPKLPGFSGVAGFDPLQTQGQNMVLGSTGSQADIVGSAGQGNQFLTSGAVLDANTNPYLQGTMDAAVRPIYSNLMDTVLPKIRNNAVMSGNYGGSRQGIAEGLAISRANDAAADATAKIGSAGYTAGLDAMNKAQGQSAQIAGSQSLPGLTTSGVGDIRQALQQALLGEQTQNWNYEQTLPLMMAKELAGIAAGIPGGSTTTTANVPQQSTGMQVAGMAMSALPFLAMMSDSRTKQNSVRIGTLDGLNIPVYRFQYLMDSQVRIGLMADDVEKVLPEAVTTLNGVKFINYPMVFEALEKAQ